MSHTSRRSNSSRGPRWDTVREAYLGPPPPLPKYLSEVRHVCALVLAALRRLAVLVARRRLPSSSTSTSSSGAGWVASARGFLTGAADDMALALRFREAALGALGLSAEALGALGLSTGALWATGLGAGGLAGRGLMTTGAAEERRGPHRGQKKRERTKVQATICMSKAY
jgi:hypothetical protein